MASHDTWNAREKRYLPVVEQLARQRGLDFSHYRSGCLVRRIESRMCARGVASVDEYLAVLANDAAEYGHLQSALTINVTEFWRNPETYDALVRDVIPGIIANARRRSVARIRCWCAGAATGEEAYSVAILFAEAFRREGRQYPCIVQATDIDREVLASAEQGRYPSQAVRHLPKALVTAYFRSSRGSVLVADELRAMVRFRYHDLAGDRPVLANDLILCRNVLIYFDHDLQQRVCAKFHKGLMPGGVLVLGKAETLADPAHGFMTINPAERIYRKRE